MTGGQASGTTPLGARTATTPDGNPDRPHDLMALVLASGCTSAARFSALPKSPLLAINALSEALKFRGFSFIEFIAPCATHFTRKNRIGSAADLAAFLDDLIVPKRKALTLPKEKKAGKLISGAFTDLNDYLKARE